MNKLNFSLDWMGSDSPDPLLRATAAQLKITVGDSCLTRNIDCWSSSLHDFISVSVYPLALWLARSWWRLNYEPLPVAGGNPDLDWRLAHALGAADCGFVWPDIFLIPDGEQMNIWTDALSEPGQSVLYTSGQEGCHTVSLSSFRQSAGSLIECVLRRLESMGQPASPLSSLWQLILEDSADSGELRLRQLEALLGHDPEECPEELLQTALCQQEQIGPTALSEFLPVLRQNLHAIDDYRHAPGLAGLPLDILRCGGSAVSSPTDPPWEQGRKAAVVLRRQLGLKNSPVPEELLRELLGLGGMQYNAQISSLPWDIAVGRPAERNQWLWIPRKRHPMGQRFEMARFIGGLFCRTEQDSSWIISSDLASAAQKKQRAFAAEFLCPLQGLLEFMNNQFSESVQEKAADYFMVSEKIVAGKLEYKLTLRDNLLN